MDQLFSRALKNGIVPDFFRDAYQIEPETYQPQISADQMRVNATHATNVMLRKRISETQNYFRNLVELFLPTETKCVLSSFFQENYSPF